jgi:N-acyl-D-aspartate/D-glutamate deacylase
VLASRLAADLCIRDGRIAIQVGDSHRDDAITRRLGDGSGIILLP